MVIITADDFGKTRHATDSILKCASEERITSASAMVYMEDSERSAALASRTGLEIGLHINLTMPLTARKVPQVFFERHKRVVSYLTTHKLAQVIYNPLLADIFSFVFMAQQEEFIRLYGRHPSFYNGHHHMHLCANMLLGKILPKGHRVRRTFTFDASEKGLPNRLYRCVLDAIVDRRFTSTDSFFSILPLEDLQRLRIILARSTDSNVEIEVHPENVLERDFLLSDQFRELLSSVHAGTFHDLTIRN
jgi:chitin disaccharide deacetylase